LSATPVNAPESNAENHEPDLDDVNLILYLKELWRRRALAGLAVVVAAAIPVLAILQVSLLPPSI